MNRQGDPPERGRFRCEVPNADSVLVTMYVNIGECRNLTDSGWLGHTNLNICFSDPAGSHFAEFQKKKKGVVKYWQ